MKSSTVLCCLLILLAGCNEDEKIIGKWQESNYGREKITITESELIFEDTPPLRLKYEVLKVSKNEVTINLVLPNSKEAKHTVTFQGSDFITIKNIDVTSVKSNTYKRIE